MEKPKTYTPYPNEQALNNINATKKKTITTSKSIRTYKNKQTTIKIHLSSITNLEIKKKKQKHYTNIKNSTQTYQPYRKIKNTKPQTTSTY